MTRSVDDLAAAIRDAIPESYEVMPLTDANPFAALSELVALVGTLTQERDAFHVTLVKWTERAEAAEAALADMRRALANLESWQPITPQGMEHLHPQHVQALHEARRALAAAGPAPEETT